MIDPTPNPTKAPMIPHQTDVLPKISGNAMAPAIAPTMAPVTAGFAASSRSFAVLNDALDVSC
jgi:hypothetical protein